jgi:uncharacterized membrane protein (UPF0182 family)
MTIGITGPEQKAPGRRNVLAGLIVVGIASAIGLILLGQLGDFLVDTMWFSAIGYSQVFWTTVAAKVGVFLAVFAATFLITWASAGLALHRRRRDVRPPTAFDWKLAAPATSSDLLDLILSRLPFSVVIAAGAGFVALLAAFWEIGNWNVILQFLYRVPYGANDPVYDKDLGFYLFPSRPTSR